MVETIMEKTRSKNPGNPMNEPTLYAEYSQEQAESFFGSTKKAKNLCDGQWLILPDHVLCFANLGEAPRKSHFKNGSCFCWVVEKPLGQEEEYVPDEVDAGRMKERPIHLFVRGIDSQSFTYVGQLRESHRSFRKTLPSGDSFGDADFDLRSILPSQIWNKLTGFDPGNLDHESVDLALARLKKQISVQDRLEVLRTIVEYWHGPIGADDGLGEDEIGEFPLPFPLRWWFKFAGRRTEIMSGQNFLLEPKETSLDDDGRLIFHVENQGGYAWATPTDDDDPPVFGSVDGVPKKQPEGISLSEHLILACLFEAIICHSSYGASSSWIEQDKLNQIVRHVPPISIGTWNWCETRFLCKEWGIHVFQQLWGRR